MCEKATWRAQSNRLMKYCCKERDSDMHLIFAQLISPESLMTFLNNLSDKRRSAFTVTLEIGEINGLTQEVW